MSKKQEAIKKATYDTKLAAARTTLANVSIASLTEIAATTPGGPLDAPFAPIDPTMVAAARQLIDEAGIPSVQQRVVQISGTH